MLYVMLSFAEYMLSRCGKFYPYAGALSWKDQMICVPAIDVRDSEHRSDASASLTMLCQRLERGISAGKYKLAAVVYNARIILPTTMQRSSAVAIPVKHRSGHSELVYLPNERTDGQLRFRKLLVGKRRPDIPREE